MRRKSFFSVFMTVMMLCFLPIAACQTHTEHTYGEWQTVKEATCIEEGQRVRKCIECGDEQNESIPKVAHKVASLQVIQKPTCIQPGEESGVCSVCEQTVSQPIAALGHDKLTAWSSDADSHWHACSRCDEHLDVGSHQIVNGNCSICEFSEAVLAELTFELLDDGTYTVTGYTNEDATAVSIPSTYEGVAVTQIAQNAFGSSQQIVSIVIPDSITTIGNFAFWDTGITSITIPDSVTSMGAQMFQQCINLQSVVLGRGLTSIPDSTFSQCSNLNNVEIPNTITSIGKNAFYKTSIKRIVLTSKEITLGKYCFWECSQLEEVVFDEGVETITVNSGSYPFYKPSAVRVYFSSTVSSIGKNLFSYSDSLQEIEVSQNNQNYASVDGILYDKAVTSIIKVPVGIKGEVNIANGVQEIPSNAFWCCYDITAINIPNTVTKINTEAFGNTNITSISFPDSVRTFGQDIFNSVSTLKSLHLGSGASSGVDAIMRKCTSILDMISVSEQNEKFSSKNNCLLSKDGKTRYISNSQLTIPQGVEKLAHYVFYNNQSITSFVIPEGITTVDGFSGCSNLINVTLPSTATQIANEAFTNCTSLISIAIPQTVTYIGQGAFYKCSSLTKIIFDDPTGWQRIQFSPSDAENMDFSDPVANVAFFTGNNMRHFEKDKNY